MTTEDHDAPGDGLIEASDRTWLTPGVGAVGAASFFSDTGHEVTTSVLPTFLTGTLGASAAALGVIDGISDALIGVMKLIGGPLANDPGRRGPTASGGYLGTALATGAIGAAVTVWQAGLFRAIAWLSRGLRSPARDALLASLSPESTQQGIWPRTGGRQPGRGSGAVAGGRIGGLGGYPARALPGSHPWTVRSGGDHRGRSRVTPPGRCRGGADAAAIRVGSVA